MKTDRSWPLALLLMLPSLAPAAEPTASSQIASSSEPAYESMDISEIIERVAKRTGKEFIVDPRVRTGIPLIGLDAARIDYPKLLAILTVNQYVAYESNGIVKIIPDASARQLPIPVSGEVKSTVLDDELVTVIIHVKNACAAQLVPVLRPLMPQNAHLAAMPQSNTLLIFDHAGNARRIIDMVERLDKAAPAGEKCPPALPPSPKAEAK